MIIVLMLFAFVVLLHFYVSDDDFPDHDLYA